MTAWESIEAEQNPYLASTIYRITTEDGAVVTVTLADRIMMTMTACDRWKALHDAVERATCAG